MNRDVEVRICKIDGRTPIVLADGLPNRGVGFHPELDPSEKPVQEGEVQNWPPTTRGLRDTEEVLVKARADLGSTSTALLRSRESTSSCSTRRASSDEGWRKGGGRGQSGGFPVVQERRNPDRMTPTTKGEIGRASHAPRCLLREPTGKVAGGHDRGQVIVEPCHPWACPYPCSKIPD